MRIKSIIQNKFPRKIVAEAAVGIALGIAYMAIPIGGLYLTSKSVEPETRGGEYRGYPVETIKEESGRMVFIHPPGKPYALCAKDWYSRERRFTYIEPTMLPLDNPLRELANPEEMENAWQAIWREENSK